MYEIEQGQFRTPAGNAVTMLYRRGTNDWNTLNASLDQDEYKLPSGRSGNALDVGGYLGSVGIALAKDNPGLRVTIVEPVPDNADLIERNVALNDLTDRVTLVRGAVGKGGEQVDVWYGYRGTEVAEHHAFVGNSSLAYDNGGALDHQERTYTGLGLAQFLPLDFLKIDCEGGEWAFLDSPSVAEVATIIGEAHSVRGRKGRDIIDLLAATHDVTIDGDGEGTCEFWAVRR